MIKDYKSYSEDWLFHENAWSSFNAKEISVDFAEVLKLANEANNTIRSTGLEGIACPNISITQYDIKRLETEREKLQLFCKKIHTDAENIIDDIFHYGIMKTLADVYALNPSTITCTVSGTEYNLKSEMERVIFDPALKADFSEKAGKLDTDKPSDKLKESLIEAVSRYYDGNVTPYMTKSPGKDIKSFNEDMDLVIEYYEYLNPKDGKDLNKFLSGLAQDSDKKFQEDIRNIKFISYTAREPHRSVFFQYLNKLKISDYDLPEVYSNGDRPSQYYSSDTKSLYLRFYSSNGEGKNDPRGAYVTFFHEVGHGIDDLMQKDNKILFWTSKVNFYSTNGDELSVFKAAEKDIRENIRNTVDIYIGRVGYQITDSNKEKIVEGIMTYNFKGFTNPKMQDIYNKVISDYKNKFSRNVTNATIYNGISDVYGGFSDNKLAGTYSHDNAIKKDGSTYWNNSDKSNSYKGSQGKELWAHIFARFMTSNDLAIDEYEYYFPSTMELMNEILKN